MPADGSLPPKKRDFGTSAGAAQRLNYINGATGRMGTTQHMAHLLAIAAEGGLKLENGDRLIPELMLVGRDAARTAALAAAHGDQRWTTNLDRRTLLRSIVMVWIDQAMKRGRGRDFAFALVNLK